MTRSTAPGNSSLLLLFLVLGPSFELEEVGSRRHHPLSAFINDPVIMHEPFFQQTIPASVKQELQITLVEAVTFFQNSGTSPLHSVNSFNFNY
ncbi:hypothetical protein LINGRAHAP2_LOCUS23169, partial [Linum grandiflorum]